MIVSALSWTPLVVGVGLGLGEVEGVGLGVDVVGVGLDVGVGLGEGLGVGVGLDTTVPLVVEPTTELAVVSKVFRSCCLAVSMLRQSSFKMPPVSPLLGFQLQ